MEIEEPVETKITLNNKKERGADDSGRLFIRRGHLFNNLQVISVANQAGKCSAQLSLV